MDMKKWMSVLLIVVGILLMSVPFAGKLYNDYQQKKLMDEFNQEILTSFIQMNEELSKLQEQTEESLQEETVEFSVSDIDTNTNQKIDLGAVIGILSIEKLKINLPILQGTSESQLTKAIGHMPETALPGEKDGNSALAGHRGHTFSVFFSDLDQMEKGDEIYIRTKEKMLKYEVYSQKVIHPTDFSVLKPKKGESIITLITCHPRNSNAKRLIVQAKLVEENVVPEE